MISKTVAKRYVHALYELAGEKNALEQVGQELAAVRDLLEKEAELRDVLQNPALDPQRKVEIFDELVGDQLNVLTHNFVRLLIRKSRIDHIELMTGEYAAMERTRKGVLEVEITTARELDKGIRDELESSLSGTLGKSIEMKTAVEPSLIGGMVARIGDTVYDGSVEHQLARIQQRLGEE